MGRERLIHNEKTTIPEPAALVGTVTTSAADTKKLIYSGSDDIASIITPDSIGLTSSTFWLYVPGKTPFVSRIIGVHPNYNDFDSTDPDAFATATVKDYTLTLETAIPSCSASPCSYVRAGVAYSYSVDSGTPTINGVVVATGNGNSYNPFETYSNRPKLQPVSYVDATTADVFVSEEL